MIEATGDLWEIGAHADAIVITTNGVVTVTGENIMGGGCAKEAADRYEWLPRALGRKLTLGGNHVHAFMTEEGMVIVTMPTKDDVRKPSTLPLVAQSAQELAQMADTWGWKKVALPRPGCGLGGLRWEDVKPILDAALDDRFTVVTFA